MTAPHKIFNDDLSPRAPSARPPKSVRPYLAPAGSSPVADLHHRIEIAALQGFFDKRPVRVRRVRPHRAVFAVAIVTGIWGLILGAVRLGIQ